MIHHNHIEYPQLKLMISNDELRLGGNQKLKIYGRLDCKSGKRMKSSNRVFFINEQEAQAMNYRPCGHCLPIQYKTWRNGLI